MHNDVGTNTMLFCLVVSALTNFALLGLLGWHHRFAERVAKERDEAYCARLRDLVGMK